MWRGVEHTYTAMAVYYNENNKFNAQWLRELIRKGAIGDVDESSIEDVVYTQCRHWNVVICSA